MLMDVDLDATTVMPDEKAESRIPCCSVDSPPHQQYHPYERQKENLSSCRRRQEEIRPDDALRNRPSRIPCKPQAAQRNRGDGSVDFKDGEKDDDNNSACDGHQGNDQFMEMDRKMRRLRERMDRWSFDLKQWSHQMNGRLEVHRHRSYVCLDPSCRVFDRSCIDSWTGQRRHVSLTRSFER